VLFSLNPQCPPDQCLKTYGPQNPLCYKCRPRIIKPACEDSPTGTSIPNGSVCLGGCYTQDRDKDQCEPGTIGRPPDYIGNSKACCSCTSIIEENCRACGTDGTGSQLSKAKCDGGGKFQPGKFEGVSLSEGSPGQCKLKCNACVCSGGANLCDDAPSSDDSSSSSSSSIV